MTRTDYRILRRLMTAPRTDTSPGEYWCHPEYGAGLRQYIGQPLDVAKISALIKAQVLLEDGVAKSPAPVVTVTSSASDEAAGGFSVSIQYTNRPSKAPTVLTISLP